MSHPQFSPPVYVRRELAPCEAMLGGWLRGTPDEADTAFELGSIVTDEYGLAGSWKVTRLQLEDVAPGRTPAIVKVFVHLVEVPG